MIARKVRSFRTMIALALTAMLMLGVMKTALAEVNAVTPSTNDENTDKGWAHVEVVDDTRIGEIDLKFVSTRGFWSCFEYRSDGDTDQKISDDNFNADIDDGLYPYVCVNDSTAERTLYANEYVEVRMVFGAETDERFDWTRFEVLPAVAPQPASADECKNGGFADFGFKNQGQCIQYVNTGKDSR